MPMGNEWNRESTIHRGERNVESVVLARLIERHPVGLTRAQVVEGLTAIVDTPERVAAIGAAIDGLEGVSLVVSADDLLHPTPAALRAGELELGL
jgi:hypothetical protein